jgi:hypothetical protein
MCFYEVTSAACTKEVLGTTRAWIYWLQVRDTKGKVTKYFLGPALVLCCQPCQPAPLFSSAKSHRTGIQLLSSNLALAALQPFEQAT